MNEKEIRVKWLHEVLSYMTGEEIYLPCEGKREMKALYKRFVADLRELEEIDPLEGTKIHISISFKDMKHWVVLRKVAASPLVAYKKDVEGAISKVRLDSISSRERRLKAMREDGLGLVEVEELEDGLTEDERRLWDG